MKQPDWHTDLVNRLLAALPGVWWKQPVGTFRYLKSEAKIEINIGGMCDLGGILENGRAGQIEVKTGEQVHEKNMGRRPNQMAWFRRISGMGAFYAVAAAGQREDIPAVVADLAERVRKAGSEPAFPREPAE